MVNKRVAIITLVMERDFPHAKASLASLESQLSSNRHHFVLVNDRPGAIIPMDDHPNRSILRASGNLGVAKGRNWLIGKALNWGADLIVAFDDDLLAPSDYLDLIEQEFDRLSETEPIGVFAPTLLDYHASRNLLYREKEAEQLDRGEYVHQRETYEIKRALARRKDPIPKDVAFHMGVSDWRLHYLRPYGHYVKRIRSELDEILESDTFGSQIDYSATLVKNHLSSRKRIVEFESPPLSVDTLPGGVSCYSADLVHAIGLMDEAYSPFAFEDTDFSIRALRAGFRNFVLPRAVLIHDFQGRLRDRQRPTVIAARGKMRSLLIREHVSLAEAFAYLPEATLMGAIDAWGRSKAGSQETRIGRELAATVQYIAGVVHGAFRHSVGPTTKRDLWSELSQTVTAGEGPSPEFSETVIEGWRGRLNDLRHKAPPFAFDHLKVTRSERSSASNEIRLTMTGGVRISNLRSSDPRLDLRASVSTGAVGQATKAQISVAFGGDVIGHLAIEAVGMHKDEREPESTDNDLALQSLEAKFWIREAASLRKSFRQDASGPANQLLGNVLSDLQDPGPWSLTLRASSPDAIPIEVIRSSSDSELRNSMALEVSGAASIRVIPDEIRPHVLFAPHNAYHTREMMMIAEVLQDRGHAIGFVDITDDYRDEGSREILREVSAGVFNYSRDLLKRLGPQGIFVMNDWGGPPAAMIRQARHLGIVSFALVEGVQDYADTHVEHLGTGRIRLPYTHADVVLAVGEDDRRHLPDREVYVTGSSRIERLALEERTTKRNGLALLNANFTYGVYADPAPAWIAAAVEACSDAGIDYVISQHHADQTDLTAYLTTNAPLYDELREASVFISRFSGAILEAMALDTPVVYFNPHGERVEKFQGDHGAFPVARTAEELKSALRDVINTPREVIAERQKRFFDQHVSIVDDRSVSQRVADVIEHRALDPNARVSQETPTSPWGWETRSA